MEITKEKKIEKIIEKCKGYDDEFGKGNWCLTRHIAEDSTKLLRRNYREWTPFEMLTYEEIEAVSNHYKISKALHDSIILSMLYLDNEELHQLIIRWNNAWLLI